MDETPAYAATSAPLKPPTQMRSSSRISLALTHTLVSHSRTCTCAHTPELTLTRAQSPLAHGHARELMLEYTRVCVCVRDTRAESRETSLPGPWTGPRHSSCLCGDGASWLVPTARPAPDRGRCRDCGTVSPGPAPGVCRCAAAGAWRCPASVAWARRSGSPEPGDTSLLSQTRPPNAQATSEGRV